MTAGPGGVNETLTEVGQVHGTDGATAVLGKTDHGDDGGQQSKSPRQIAFARLRKDRIAVICTVIIGLFLLMGIFAPLIAGIEGQNPTDPHFDLIGDDNLPTFYTSGDHWLGLTANSGYDVFARFVYGIRPSFAIALIVTIVTTIIGVLLGLVAGFFGGWIDRVIGWLVDFVLSLPFLLFAIALVPIMTTYLVPGGQPTSSEVQKIRIFAVFIALIFFGWAGLCRLIRGEVLALREREFVQAARSLGAPTKRILFKEMLPNLTSVILVAFTTSLPAWIGAEAGLSYLGVGISLPTADWGLDIALGQQQMQAFPLPMLVPLVGLLILVLCLSLLGDAVSDAFNPNTRR
ncbi:peptide ABC transporter permease [Flexivirga endophytica]|uniref:Peptide ABC transporter permease n=1 Tax=Flexivirga endophytica TaxID=1849103 RepID=A0A916WU54_9MICO|nr:ABC transporter permease [Flexivirga endophytica]GGB32853.1 peptide ABC transporter permease [Flexivirga endophytica]GHB40843.1 peptide ABC transporter permease [Flexivirga endophytica]